MAIQNLLVNDEYAFAIVYNAEFAVDTDGDGSPDDWFRDGDIISGTDWDNNGLIDMLEDNPFLYHRISEVELASSTQLPQTNPGGGLIGDECEGIFCI